MVSKTLSAQIPYRGVVPGGCYGPDESSQVSTFHVFNDGFDRPGGFAWGVGMGCGGVAGGADRSAGGLEIRFAIRALAIVVQVFALRLRNGNRGWCGAGLGLCMGWSFRFAIRA